MCYIEIRYCNYHIKHQKTFYIYIVSVHFIAVYAKWEANYHVYICIVWWVDLHNKRYEITWCLIVYKIFSFIIQSTSSVLSRIFNYYMYNLQVELQT